MLAGLFGLSEDTNSVLSDALLILAVVAASVAFVKLIWHPRSWFRRVPTYIIVRVVVEPSARRLTLWLEAFIDRVVTPEIACLSTKIDVLSLRNDTQHATNLESINALTARIDATNQGLVKTNDKLADLSSTLAAHALANPGFPASERAAG